MHSDAIEHDRFERLRKVKYIRIKKRQKQSPAGPELLF